MHEGFRRAGITHFRDWVYHDRADFTDEQWELLINEPNLMVQELPEGFAGEIKDVRLVSDPDAIMRLAAETDALLAQESEKNSKSSKKLVGDV